MADAGLRELERVALAAPEDEEAQERHNHALVRAGYVAKRLWFVGMAKRGRLTHCCAPEKGGPPPLAVCGQAIDPGSVQAEAWHWVTCSRCQSSVFSDWGSRWAPHAEAAFQAGVSLVRWERDV